MDSNFIDMDLEFENITIGIVEIIKVWGKFSLYKYNLYSQLSLSKWYLLIYYLYFTFRCRAKCSMDHDETNMRITCDNHNHGINTGKREKTASSVKVENNL